MKNTLKKTGSAFILILLLAPFIVADDASDDSLVADDVLAFKTSHGSEMRMLQLTNAIEKGIMSGEIVIEYVGDTADTTGLEAILAEMNALLDEVKATTPTTGDDGAQTFTDLKSDARELTRDFREASRSLIPEGEAKDLRKSITNASKNWNRQRKAEIKAKRQAHNVENAGKIMDTLGIDDPDLLANISSGDAKMSDVVKTFRNAFKDMNKTEKRNAIQSLKETNVKGKVFARAVADKVQMNQMARMQKRIENRLVKAQDMNVSDDVLEKLSNKSANIEERMLKVKDRMMMRAGKIAKINERKVNRIEGGMNKLQNRSDNKVARMTDQLNSDNVTERKRIRIEKAIGKVEDSTARKITRMENHATKIAKRGNRLSAMANAGGKR